MLAAGLEDSLQYKVSLVCFRSQRDWAKGALQLCDLNHTGVVDDRHKHTLSSGAFFGRRNSIKKLDSFLSQCQKKQACYYKRRKIKISIITNKYCKSFSLFQERVERTRYSRLQHLCNVSFNHADKLYSNDMQYSSCPNVRFTEQIH